jgi:hypothetical protein
MKPIGYYTSAHIPQDVEDVLINLPYDAKIQIGQGIISTAKQTTAHSKTFSGSPVEYFVEELPHPERVRLGAALIMIAADEFDEIEDQRRRGNQ